MKTPARSHAEVLDKGVPVFEYGTSIRKDAAMRASPRKRP
jgi:urocanate hydratase